ncbi:DUF1360 domain-containing protein [Priestia koreensis]|uniref:Sporulation protein n=1 Tax=Priestia koreensis TaxID=284581 RepID=A0A0M0LH03_9BACI|nr:DUF1360 domain-containing protein [Priestia koreensis]KOO50339.1 sporulation protein [Priestia koreensis]
MTWLYLVLFVFATFRLTRLIVFDKITWFIRAPFHEVIEEKQEDGTVDTYLHVKGKGLRKWIGELLSCYWCTGMWCAIALYFGLVYASAIVLPIVIILAVAGCAGLIENMIK